MTVGRHTGSVSDSARTIVAVHVARLPRTLTRHNVDAHANSERRRRWDASPRLSDSQQGCSSGCARRCVRAGAADPHVGEHRGSDVVATAGAWTHAHQSSARRCDTATPPATIVPRRRHSRQQRGCEQHTRRDVHSAARTLSAMATRRCMGAQSLWGHGSDPRAFAQGPPLHMVLIFGAPSWGSFLTNGVCQACTILSKENGRSTFRHGSPERGGRFSCMTALYSSFEEIHLTRGTTCTESSLPC
jgi:hypothetical protein